MTSTEWMWIGIVALVFGLAACQSLSRLDSADAGRTVTYAPGVPNFDLEALGVQEDGAPVLAVYLNIPRLSLVFVEAEQGYRAHFEVLVRLLDQQGRDLVQEILETDSLHVATYEETQSFDPILRTYRYPAEPGTYVVEVTLIDGESEQEAVRRQRVEVPAIGSAPYLSAIRLEGRRPGSRVEPVVALHVPSSIDSLRAVVELYQPAEAGAAGLQMTLLRFPSDTAVARPPHWIGASYGSLSYHGIFYDRPDTLQVTRRTIGPVDAAVTVEFTLPDLEEGIYRLAITARVAGPDATAEDERLVQQRAFTVRGPQFPRLILIDEMIEALAYIAYDDELEEIKAGATPYERKRRFDAFWGRLVANRQVAADLIERYYSRIEEANLRFTTHKAGWKTDRGMIYVVLGPPLYVEDDFDTEQWHYSYTAGDPLSTYVFERVHPYGSDATFENYILERHLQYEPAWSEAVQRWREGEVL